MAIGYVYCVYLILSLCTVHNTKSHAENRINRKQKLDQCPGADISLAAFRHGAKVETIDPA